MNPKRLQRSRAKGWRKPEGAIIVDRSSKWGNSFKLIGDMIYCDASHRRTIFDKWVIYDQEELYSKEKGTKKVVELFTRWIYGTLPPQDYFNSGVVKPCPFTIRDIERELRDRDLICWCPKNQDCHSRILIHLANN